MSTPAIPDLVKVTEVFLVPSSFLVAALGTADTNPHRAGVSLIGLVVSVLWWVCSWEALAEHHMMTQAESRAKSKRIRIMAYLPIFFVGCWLVSLVGHLLIWNRPLGH